MRSTRKAVRRIVRHVLYLGVVAFTLLLPLGFTHAEDLQFGTKWPIDIDDPEAAVPSVAEANAQPLAFGYYLMELARFAEEAEKAKNWGRAAQFYRAMAKAVPQRATAPRRLCSAELAAGNQEAAQAACRETLNRDGATVGDFQRWIKLVARADDALDEETLADAKAVVEHMRTLPESKTASFEAECELGVRLKDRTMLDTCVPELLRLAPESVSTVAYAWNSAIVSGDLTAADKLVERARELGVDATTAERMHAVTLRASEEQRFVSGCAGCRATSATSPEYLMAFAWLSIAFAGSQTRRRGHAAYTRE